MKYINLVILPFIFLACSPSSQNGDELQNKNNTQMTAKTQTTSTASIELVEMPSRTLAYVRNVGPYMGDSALFGRLFTKVSDWAGPKGLLASPETEAISIYHDDPEAVPPAEQRISVGFTVPDGTLGEGDIEIMEIPSGKYVIGSFEILPDEYGAAWGEVMKYIESSNRVPVGIMYESYKNDPHEHPEGKHLVDICVGVKEKNK